MDLEDKKHVENKEFKDLMTLQHNVKVQPELYTTDTVKAVNVFKEEYNKVKNNPGPKNERFNHYCSFLAHVSDIFRKDLSFLPTFLYELLLNYGTILHPHIRMKCVQCIIMMRNKEVVPPIEALNIFFKLLTIKDKEMRKLIIAHIINDIKRMNVQRKNLPVNKQVQNYIFDIIKNNHDVLAKRAIFIIISLYRKQVWNDAKAVNVISSGCFNENDKVVLMACNFLIQTTEETYESDSEDEEEVTYTAHNKKNKPVGKKTKAKEMQKEREMKRIKRKERRKSKIQLMKNFFPIDMINNPQDFCDKLFNHLKKKNHKFEVKLAIMSVLGRMIGRHHLIVMNFYPYMIKYLMPHQREIGKILAYVAESTHELTPPDDLQFVLKHLVENFVTERATEEKMTMGFHTIKEMSERSPLMMDEFHLNYLAEYKSYKEKNVAGAARALINYFRDVNPDLLDKKHRGRFDMLDKKENRKTYMYGETKVCERVDGADLLKSRQGIPAEADRILTDDDFRMIRVLKKRKLEEEADKLNNLNQYTRKEKREDGDEWEDVDGDDEDVEGLDAEADEDDDEDLEEMEEDDGEIVDGEDVEDGEGEDDDDDSDMDELEDEEGEEGEDEENAEGKEGDKESKKQKKVKNGEEKVVRDNEKVEQWELDELTSDEDENPNNFVSVDSLTKFKKRKKQRLIEEKEKEKVKEKKDWTPKYKKNRKGPEKGIKNYEKEKNKNLLMVRPKKNRQKDDLKMLKSNINSMRRQLGHVRNKKEARSKLVKYQRKFK